MNPQAKIVLFADKNSRNHWGAEHEEWFFLWAMRWQHSQPVQTPQII